MTNLTHPRVVEPPTVEEIELILEPGGHMAYFHHCHGASVAIVGSGKLEGRARVARGRCEGVGGQHSWVVLSDDVYDEDAYIVDPTLWSYRDDVDGIYIGPADRFGHTPHGAGSIWTYDKPDLPSGPVIPCPGDLSEDAALFLSMAAPLGLDRAGWGVLLHSPVGGWPAAEIITAAHADRQLAAMVPVDILGHLTEVIASYLPPSWPAATYLQAPPEEPAEGMVPNGVHCIECDSYEGPDDDYDLTVNEWPPDCANCGSDVVEWVRILPCPKPAGCDSDVHHYGSGDHVHDIEPR